MKEWIKDHRTIPLERIFKSVNAKLRGHYQYYVVTDNTREVKSYLSQTKWLLFKWLNSRSQRKSYKNTFYNGLLKTFPLLEPSKVVCVNSARMDVYIVFSGNNNLINVQYFR